MARSVRKICLPPFTLIVLTLFMLGCSLGDMLAPEPTLAPTRRPRTATPRATPTDTEAPTETPIPTNTPTLTPLPPTHTPTSSPVTATFTPRPPTATFTRRPPTATFTLAPPTNTPTPTFALTFHWINTGRPFDVNECGWPNGTHIRGVVKKADGTLLTGAIRTAGMHLWIKGDGGGLFAYPGLYRDFPNWNDGRWDAEFPRRAQDFEWHIFISAKHSDEPLSADLWGVASAENKCGQPGTKNFFVADWISR